VSRIEILMTVPISQTAGNALDERFLVHRLWEQADPAAFLAAAGGRIRGAATSTGFGRVGHELLALLPHLEIVASFGVGYDNIDTAACARRGVVVTNTPDVLDEEVADLALGLTLATLRRIPQADRFVRAGLWEKGSFPLSPTLRGRHVGIVGLGRIGKTVARRFEGFGVPIGYHGRHRQEVPYAYHSDLRGLAEVSDLLVVCTPGGSETRRMIDAALLEALGPQGVLINVSRGSVVDQAALIAALRAGTILAAGLDVLEDEPHVPAALLALDNVVVLPHVGSRSLHTRNAAGRLVADNLLSWFAGSGPLTPVAETPFRGPVRASDRTG
jgi:lactate dehydrogenase-like 2-hydroxyacid dehydrogenase